MTATVDSKGQDMSRGTARPLWTGAVLLCGLWAAAAPVPHDTVALMEQLRGGVPEAQRNAATALAKAGAAAVNPLIAALQDQDERVRFHAAWALKEIGKPAVQALGAVLAGDHAAARYPAAYALADSREKSLLPAWLTAVGDADFRVRYYAVRALSALDDPRVGVAIEGALADETPLVRQAAAGAAARAGNASGIEGLSALMHPGVDADTRFRAAFSLWELKDQRVVPALIRGLTDADPRVRHHCAWALGDLNANAGAKPLIAVLQDSSDDTLKSYAAASLKQITGQQFGFDAAKWRGWLEGSELTGPGEKR